ncbi:MAG: metal ABC transporter ATP-binding protein [Candidatus Dadabacteria bacterium]|nr:metal ABC transporter ATP-binding protein [Candidatus Dadabacteria bacterium]MDE0291739.1 metal ABC transporter ATP-binding protein [Candidatus Dadabacteria bacterium]MDE0476446.1 metal ABC transporter ATP-binding protein [Candidatus Dadabacteria bacterium]
MIKTIKRSGRRCKIFSVLVFFLFSSACATSPKDIAPAHVSPYRYGKYNCEEIAMEMEMVGQRTTTLYASLKKRASSDKKKGWLGALLFWPALLLIKGDSPEAAEYSQLRGEYKALEIAATKKKCMLSEIKSPEQIVEEAHERDKKEAEEEAEKE